MKKLTFCTLFMCQLSFAFAQWSITGNSGTSPASNFLGTIDNVSLLLKTNSFQRVSVSQNYTYGSRNVSYVNLGQPDSLSKPTSLGVYSSDIVGYALPVFISCDISGMTYDYDNGTSNTLGRFIRFNQGNTNAAGGNHWYDFGMQDSISNYSFYITQHQVPGGGYFPKKMVTISSNDQVGINMDWSDQPTADLHTKGTVRHEGLPGGEGHYIVADDQGNLYVSRCHTDDKCGEGRTAKQEIEQLKNEIAELKRRLDNNATINTINASKIILNQNNPNPFISKTSLSFSIPPDIKRASLYIYNLEGKQLKSIVISPSLNDLATVQGSELTAGIYLAMIVCDNGATSNTVKMVLTK